MQKVIEIIYEKKNWDKIVVETKNGYNRVRKRFWPETKIGKLEKNIMGEKNW